MAKLSHLEKEYIKANHKNKTAEELSKKLEKDKELVEEYIKELQNRQSKKNNKNERKENKAINTIKKMFFEDKEKSEPIYKKYSIKPYRLSKIDFIFASISFLFAFFLYLFTLTPSLSAGDNGELTTAAWLNWQSS